MQDERSDQAKTDAIVVEMNGRGRLHATTVSERLIEAQGQAKFREGSIIQSKLSGSRYRLEHVQPGRVATIRREVPKVRGKGARRAEKRARRRGGLL